MKARETKLELSRRKFFNVLLGVAVAGALPLPSGLRVLLEASKDVKPKASFITFQIVFETLADAERFEKHGFSRSITKELAA